MHIQLLGALELSPVSPSGEKVTELSDLAWDEDNRLLYAISDWGALFHLRPIFTDAQLVDLEFVAQYPLRDFDGKPLRGKMADAEGLDAQHTANAVVDDTELLVSFERIPRLIRFSPQGYPIATVPLPAPLQDKQRFHSANKGLEAVIYHPTAQWFIGSEWPLKGASTHIHQIFRADGQTFFFPRHPAKKSALVAMSTLPNAKIIALERSFDPTTTTVIISLRLLPAPHEWLSQQISNAPILAEFSSLGPWNLDNFEGLTRHRGHRFLMVSDNNENFFQRTLLVYFEVIDPEQ